MHIYTWQVRIAATHYVVACEALAGELSFAASRSRLQIRSPRIEYCSSLGAKACAKDGDVDPAGGEISYMWTSGLTKLWNVLVLWEKLGLLWIGNE